MKKALWYLVGAVFFVSTLAFAADKSASPVMTGPVKANNIKVAKMHATGKVIEISNESIKIERTVKGDIETMDFDLDKPAINIMVNDSVKIDYTEKDGRLVASRVVKVTVKKKEVKITETKPVSDKK